MSRSRGTVYLGNGHLIGLAGDGYLPLLGNGFEAESVRLDMETMMLSDNAGTVRREARRREALESKAPERAAIPSDSHISVSGSTESCSLRRETVLGVDTTLSSRKITLLVRQIADGRWNATSLTHYAMSDVRADTAKEAVKLFMSSSKQIYVCNNTKQSLAVMGYVKYEDCYGFGYGNGNGYGSGGG